MFLISRRKPNSLKIDLNIIFLEERKEDNSIRLEDNSLHSFLPFGCDYLGNIYQEKQSLKRLLELTEKKLSYTRNSKKRIHLLSRVKILTEFYEDTFGEIKRERLKVENYDLIGE